MTGDWKRLLGEEPHDLCCLKHIRMTTSRTTRYAKREINVRTGDWENAYRVLLRKIEMKEDHLEGVGVGGGTKVK